MWIQNRDGDSRQSARQTETKNENDAIWDQTDLFFFSLSLSLSLSLFWLLLSFVYFFQQFWLQMSPLVKIPEFKMPKNKARKIQETVECGRVVESETKQFVLENNTPSPSPSLALCPRIEQDNSKSPFYLVFNFFCWLFPPPGSFVFLVKVF